MHPTPMESLQKQKVFANQNVFPVCGISESYAAENKKGDSRSSTRESGLGQESLPATAISEVIISDFLEIVNSTHRSILSDNVLEKLGESRPADGYYSGEALFKLPIGEDASPRALLANAFEGIITNDIEKQKIREYKSKAEMLDIQEKKLRELRAQIKELSFAKGKRDTQKIKALQDEATKTANQRNYY